MDIHVLGENSRHTSVRVSFCFPLQAYACAYIEFSKTINKLNIFKLNTKPRAEPLIIETGRTCSYIIFGPAGPLNWADQILCDTGPFIIETDRTFSYIIFGPAGPLNWADQILCDTGSLNAEFFRFFYNTTCMAKD